VGASLEHIGPHDWCRNFATLIDRGFGEQIAQAGENACLQQLPFAGTLHGKDSEDEALMKELRAKSATAFGVAGAAVTAVLLMAFHLWPGPALRRAISYVNYFNLALCDRFAASLFKGEHIAPPFRQATIFVACLILTAGIQWFVIGWLADWLTGRWRER
jgi:hypothetical protein